MGHLSRSLIEDVPRVRDVNTLGSHRVWVGRIGKRSAVQSAQGGVNVTIARVLIILVVILSSGCQRVTTSRRGPVTPPPTGIVASTPICPATETIRAEPPRDPNADAFGMGTWYTNADRTIWAGLGVGSWVAGKEGNKVIWIRPQGSQLEVTGRRLDADAPPLSASIPCCYPTGFQVTGLFFPTEGCWEVTGKAGGHELRFVTEVRPPE